MLFGKTLAALLVAGPLPADELGIFIRQSLDAVEALHQGGWIHADLNADNFVYVQEAESWKLLELPFTRFVPPQPYSPAFGNMLTLAPEQIDGAAITVQTDLYALGCLYYAAATGKFPHASGGPQHIAVDRLRFPARDVRELAPQLDPALAAGIMKLLERGPEGPPGRCRGGAAQA